MDFLKGITPLGAVAVRSEETDHSAINVRGTFVLVKNGIVERYNYWTDVYKSNYKGYFECSDWDWEIEFKDHSQARIGDLPIDNLDAFVSGLRNNGLSSLASSYEITDDEIKQAIFEVIAESKRFANFFGKGMKCFNALSQEEKHKIKLDHVIKNYDTISDYAKKDYNLPFDEPLTAPTLAQLVEYRNKL